MICFSPTTLLLTDFKSSIINLGSGFPEPKGDNESTLLKNSKLTNNDIKNIEASYKITKRLILSIVREISKKCDENSSGFVHWGGTTRNILDAGRNIIIRDAHRSILKELSLIVLLKKLEKT